MVSLYAVWVPTLVAAHVVGFSLLLYSLEQIGGYVSKFCKSVCGMNGTKHSPKQAEEASLDSLEKGTVIKESSIYVDATSSPAAHIMGLGRPYAAELTWKDISCKVLDTKTMMPKAVLNGCTGTASPGETVALLGPSGAGKTTMLDTISGRKTGKGVKGIVTMNGAACGQMFRRISAFVPQEDSFVATLTALETLKFRASLSVPKNVPRTKRKERLRGVLEALGLWRVKDTKVGGLLPGGIEVRGLSGGEKRRLSIACALISNPSILFLDEPTTGLDSFAALNVMHYLSYLASLGHTIIASVHQPRPVIFDSFNKVAILSEGYQLYLGPPSGCVDWFQQHIKIPYLPERDGNVPDWIMDSVSVAFTKPASAAQRSLTTVKQVREAADAFKHYSSFHEAALSARNLPGDDVLDIAAPNQAEAAAWASGDYAASWHKQYRVLFNRALMSQLRNPTDTSSRLLMSTWVGTLAGLVFASLPEGAQSTQQRLALLFFMLLLYQLMPFCFMSFYVADRRFFQADVAAGLYAPSAYYLAAVSASAPFVIVNTIAGGLMAFGLTGLRYTGVSIVLYMVVLCLQSLTSNQLQIFCVWLTPNQDMAYVLATGYVASSILLSGFYIRIKAIKIGFIRALSWLSYTKYAMQGMGRIELHNRSWDPSTCSSSAADPLAGGAQPTCGTTGNQLLDYYGYTINTAILIAAMLAAYIIFHLGSYLSLSRLYKKR